MTERRLLPPNPMDSLDEWMRARNLDLDEMSDAQLMLEIESAGWIARHYAREFIWLEPGVFVYAGDWAIDRTRRIYELLQPDAVVVPQVELETEPQAVVEIPPAKTIKHKRARQWKPSLNHS